jgi:hypothetical protein
MITSTLTADAYGPFGLPMRILRLVEVDTPLRAYFPICRKSVLSKSMAGDYMYFCRCCRINMSTQHHGIPEAVPLIHGKIYSERCVVAQCEGVMYVTSRVLGVTRVT